MNNEVIELAYQLFEKLTNSNQYLQLKEKERAMLENPKANELINNYKKLEELYCENKSDEILKKLHKAKFEMDLDIHVIEYKKAYKKYQILTSEVTDIVFKDFKDDSIIEKMCKRILNN